MACRVPALAALLVAVCSSGVSCSVIGELAKRRAKTRLDNAYSGGDVPPAGLTEHKLRLCNAFAWPAPLEMRRLQEPKLVEYPLAYKACHDYVMPLKDGDRLGFRAGDMEVGTFSVAGLPEQPSLLLLVPHRKDAAGSTVAFQSHIFTESENAQVAIVDAFRGTGSEKAVPLIQEKAQREQLKFNTVVALAPGKYQVGVQWQDGAQAGSTFEKLMAQPQESYVVLRVGAGGKGSSEYPEDVVVFPQIASESAAPARTAVAGALLAALLHAVAVAAYF